MKKTIFLFLSVLLMGFAAVAQTDSAMGSDMATGTIGKIKVATFNSLNAKGAAMVKAIKPTNTPLSASDKNLMMKVAMGGQKQLALSQAALDKVTDPQAKILAQSEVEEQTTIAAKLSEVASAKGVTLPEGPDPSVQPLLDQMSSMSGADLDAFYVTQSGIKGHQKLLATMTKVNQTAKDKALKSLATATLPVIRLHLKTSTEVHTLMSGPGKSSAK